MCALFIDTHDKFVIFVLYKDGIVLAKEEIESVNSHSIHCFPLLIELLKNAKLKVTNLDEIYVCNGPGSFTGVRIGVVIAKTISYCLNIPIKAISSLKIRAISLNIEKDKIIIISDRNGKYIGEFNSLNQELSEYKYLKNDDYLQYAKDSDSIYENVKVDYDVLYNYLKEQQSPVNAHKVNPVYVKNIEV